MDEDAFRKSFRQVVENSVLRGLLSGSGRTALELSGESRANLLAPHKAGIDADTAACLEFAKLAWSAGATAQVQTPTAADQDATLESHSEGVPDVAR